MEPNPNRKCEIISKQTYPPHTDNISYCSECDIFLCSNCIPDHILNPSIIHRKKNGVIDLATHFSLFTQNITYLENKLDSFNQVNTQSNKALNPLKDNMKLIQSIQEKLNQLYERYERTVSSYEKDSKFSEIQEKEFSSLKEELKELKKIFKKGSFDEKRLLRSMFDINKKIKAYKKDKKMRETNKHQIHFQFSKKKNIRKNLNAILAKVNKIEAEMKKGFIIDNIINNNILEPTEKRNREREMSKAPLNKDNSNAQNIQKLPSSNNKESFSYPYQSENLI